MLDHLKARGYADEATAAITHAVLDLERTGAMFYALEGMRRPRPGDAGGAPLDEVAAAVLSLEWPCTRNNRPGGSRSIHEAFEELGGSYRHCDVYEAMHGLLKNHELKSGRVYWQRADVYEPTVRRIVEAKATADVVIVAHAWAQAAAYRFAANLAAPDERSTVEIIAVLLPAAPTGTARAFLEQVGADCLEVELIYPDGDAFRRERLT